MTTLTKIKSRKEVDSKFKWCLEDLFQTDDLWQKKYDQILNQIPEIESFKGKLNNLEILRECLEKIYKIYEELGRLYVYAHMRLHEDTSNNFYQGLSDKADMIQTKISVAASFIEQIGRAHV